MTPIHSPLAVPYGHHAADAASLCSLRRRVRPYMSRLRRGDHAEGGTC